MIGLRPTYIAAALATLIIILLVSKAPTPVNFRYLPVVYAQPAWSKVAKRALETARDKGPYILEEHIVSSGLEKRPHHLLFYCDFEAAIWLQCCADVSIQRRLRRGKKGIVSFSTRKFKHCIDFSGVQTCGIRAHRLQYLD